MHLNDMLANRVTVSLILFREKEPRGVKQRVCVPVNFRKIGVVVVVVMQIQAKIVCTCQSACQIFYMRVATKLLIADLRPKKEGNTKLPTESREHAKCMPPSGEKRHQSAHFKWN